VVGAGTAGCVLADPILGERLVAEGFGASA
jgi:hypothetical protein